MDAPGGVTCECGRKKGRGAAACDECSFLDGRRDSDQDLISYMRSVAARGVTLVELSEATGRDEESLRARMSQLRKLGRVSRYVDDSLTDETRGKIAWRYRLTLP